MSSLLGLTLKIVNGLSGHTKAILSTFLLFQVDIRDKDGLEKIFTSQK
jgi:hypothetical protein